MCILCVIQKWSRRLASMLPWLVIPLVGAWALSQLLPPAFQFEITSSRLACVLVLLITLLWYEILMPLLSEWRVRRNARIREKKRVETIKLQQLKKSAIRKCRNCLTAYRDQNPGGGKFMCLYCGHMSKRPVLDLPVLPGMSNSGILKDLLIRSGKILNGKVWTDNGWMCRLENGNWSSEPSAGNFGFWKKNGGDFFSEDDDLCLPEMSCSRVLIIACKALATFFWRKIFGASSSRDDTLADVDCRGLLDNHGKNGGNGQESIGDKSRRKIEEKRLARLEREFIEEEERKQREEVARLVEEHRRMRNEKVTAEERRKGSPGSKGIDCRKESERKCQEKKKGKDRGSTKSNSDAEEFEKTRIKEIEQSKKSEGDRQVQHRTTSSSKPQVAEAGLGPKSVAVGNHNGGNSGRRYLDRMRGTFLSSSRAFTGSGLFVKSVDAYVSKEDTPNPVVKNTCTYFYRKDTEHADHNSGRSTTNGDNRNANHPVIVEAQPCLPPKKLWLHLFTHTSVGSPPSLNVISEQTGMCEAVQSSSNPMQNTAVSNHPDPTSTQSFGNPIQNKAVSSHLTSTQSYDNPINFGLSSPFSLPSFSFGSNSISAVQSLSSELMVSKPKGSPHQFLPEESEIYEDPSYIPDHMTLLGPVSESLDDFQLDLGFVTDPGLEEPFVVNTKGASYEVNHLSPIGCQLSRSQVSEERHASSFVFPGTHWAQDDPNNINDNGTWQMWNSTPLAHDSLRLVGGPVSCNLHPEMNFPNTEDKIHPVPQRTMASLFKKDEQAISGSHSSQNVPFGNGQTGGAYYVPLPAIIDDPRFPNTSIGPGLRPENQILLKEGVQNSLFHGNSHGSAANSWSKEDWSGPSSGNGIGNTYTTNSTSRSHVGGLFAPSVWSYD